MQKTAMAHSKPITTASACIRKHRDDYIWDRKENNKDIYRPKMTTEKEGVCSKRSFGPPALNALNKTILLVGATGAGKSTQINAMINYILGVEWGDSSRVEMIPKETGDEAHSQTSKVTAYQINHREGYRVPYSLTIIDTPGFGDTKGVKQDQEITKRINNFFSDPTGVASIDAVCFVVQSALPRLTTTQKYIFDSILSIFGKDIKDNIVILFTFSDGKAPAALAAINAADVPCARKEDGSCLFFKFNNSVLYSGDDADDAFDEMFWKMGLISMKTFFDQLSKMECKSLQLTKEVLEERQQLETIVEGLLPKIKVGLAKSNEVNKTLEAMEQNRQFAEANMNFEYEVDTVEIIKEDISGQGIHVTNCRTCSFTCHDDCAYADDRQKKNCCAMRNGSCTVCPGKCHWSEHSNYPYKFIIKPKKETKTYENLKKNYEKAKGEDVSFEDMMTRLYDDYVAIQKDVVDSIQELSKSQKRLGEIALRPNPMTATGYIDLMIQGEKQAAQPGWDARIKELTEVRKGAEVLQKVAKKEQLLPEDKQILSTWGNIKQKARSVWKLVSN